MMASLSPARKWLRLGVRCALLASAASWVVIACSTGGGSSPPSKPTSSTGGGGADSGGSAGTDASGGADPSMGGSTVGDGAGGGVGGADDGAGGADDSAGGAADSAGGAADSVGGAADSVGGAADSVGGADDSTSSAGAGGAAPLMITNSGSKYALSFGQTYIEIDAAIGARITALRYGGAAEPNLILDQTVNAGTANADNWGSTFWPSPQTWTWPPTLVASIAAIDIGAYTVAVDVASLTLTSAVAGSPPLSVVKKFSADVAKEAIVIDYTVTNHGASAIQTAPWEITRVAGGGITFYGTGMDAPRKGNFPLPAAATITTAAGATWYAHDTSDLNDRKLLADGSGGWLAHAAGDLILVKSFPDVPLGAAAKNEAEIEIYASQSAKYVEVEQQGAVQSLAPGGSLSWTVRWYARKLAAPAAVGSADLVTYVQNLIK